MGIYKVYLVVVMSLLFISLVVADRVTSYNIKRKVPTGPNPQLSPDPVPVMAMTTNYNFIHEIKRKVPTGLNPTQSPDPVPAVERSNDCNFNHVIKRKVLTGPNPAQSPDLVPNACGGLSRDHRGSLLGAFACNIGVSTVFYAEVYGFLLALEYGTQHGWRHIWLESDSTSALLVLKTVLWYRFYFVTVGTTLATKVYRLLLLTSLGKEIVVQICWLIWVTRHKARFGSRCCLKLFRLISS
ncbi:transmembrane protein, putative [Medicago truncatula]|uniref:Transmembrane protein, putative n=1 Tax=Medicago truncatula TaxID=3880 RepID=A0A072VVN2_MEDTR|nr:transmembrane protein, putative [Medicago truncatula]